MTHIEIKKLGFALDEPLFIVVIWINLKFNSLLLRCLFRISSSFCFCAHIAVVNQTICAIMTLTSFNLPELIHSTYNQLNRMIDISISGSDLCTGVPAWQNKLCLNLSNVCYLILQLFGLPGWDVCTEVPSWFKLPWLN